MENTPSDHNSDLPARRDDGDQPSAEHSSKDEATDDREDRENQGNGHRQKRQRRHKPSFRSREELMAMLNELPGMIVAGIISIAESNAIRSVIKVMLDELDRAGGATQSSKMPDSMANKLRQDPELLEWIESFLTDQQFDEIVKGMTDDESI
jgi:hypothetical protein